MQRPQLNGDDDPLAPQKYAQRTAGGAMRSNERGQGRLAELPLFRGMLQGQPGKLGRLLGGELSPGSCTRSGIDNSSECRPSIGKPRDDERD